MTAVMLRIESPEGLVSPETMQPEHARDFAVKDRIDRTRQLAGRLAERLAAAARRARRGPMPAAVPG